MKHEIIFDLQRFNDDEPNIEKGIEEKGEEVGTEDKTEETKPIAKEKKYDDDEVNKIVQKKFKEWEKKKSAEIEEAQKLANLNELDKVVYEKNKLQNELDFLKKEKEFNSMKIEANKLLQAKNINLPDDILSRFVCEKAEDTSTAINSFIEYFEKVIEEKAKDMISGKVPFKSTAPKSLTKAEILGIADPFERQRLISENMHLFK